MGVVLAGPVLMDAGHHPVPTAGFDEPDDGDQHRAEPDEDKLQDLIKDCREQAAQSDIYGHGDRRRPDAEPDVPAEHYFHDERHGVHVDAAHEHGHGAEADGGEGAGGFAESQFEIAGNGVGFGNVIERDHHDAEEEHRRDGADPIPVSREDAVLISGAGPAHEFERAEVSGKEAESGDPRGHLAAGQEEVFTGFGKALQVKADAEDGDEIESDDGDVYAGKG